MGQLPVAMDKECLSRVLQVYDRLTQLQVLRDALATLWRDQKADWDSVSQGGGAAPWPVIGLSREFDHSAPVICDEFTSVVKTLITDGNPLQTA